MYPNYILVTPAKNEENNIPNLIESISNQQIKPIAWFIIDDSSEDRTGQIANEASLKHPWIHIIQLNEKHQYDLGKHYAYVCMEGFNKAISFCDNNHMDFDYISLSDADMNYPDDYFLKCITFLQEHIEYGIISGSLLTKDSRGSIHEDNRLTLVVGAPYGTGRVWRKKTFFDTGGYLLTKAPDTVSNILALDKGWKLKDLKEAIFYQTRDVSVRNGLWRGYLNRGERAYYLNENHLSILTAIGIIFISSQKNKLLKSLALFVGYYRSFFTRGERVENTVIRRYFGSYSRAIRDYWLFIKGFRNRRIII